MSKAPDALRTIGEVSDVVGLPQHILRFWETRFEQVRPIQKGRGRRYYRPEDIDLLKGIKRLIEVEGFTTRGAHKVLREKGTQFVQAVGRGERPRLMLKSGDDHADGEAGAQDPDDGRASSTSKGKDP